MNTDQDLETFVAEVHNIGRIPWIEMSKDAQAVLCAKWRDVETFDRDANAWVPNRVCPRQWHHEAYRLAPPVEDTRNINQAVLFNAGLSFADVQVIYAAPDLMAALESLIHAVEHEVGHVGRISDAIPQAREALAKAKYKS